MRGIGQVVLGLFLLLPVYAAGFDVHVEQLSATPFSEMTFADAHANGASKRLVAKPGRVLLLVQARLTPKWDNDRDLDFYFDQDTFGLYDGETQLPNLLDINDFNFWNMDIPPSGFLRLSGDEVVRPMWFRAIIDAPATKTSFELRMTLVKDLVRKTPKSDKVVKTIVKLAGQPQPFSAASYIDAKVVSVRLLDSVDKRENDDVHQIRNEGGKILELKIRVQPLLANSQLDQQFIWSPAHFGLAFGRGGRACCFGRDYGDGRGPVLSSAIHDLKPGDKQWPVLEETLYFPVPANLTVFDVTFLGHKVAQGQVP